MWWMMSLAFAQNWDADGFASRSEIVLPTLDASLVGLPLRIEGAIQEGARVFDGLGVELPLEREVDAAGVATGAWIRVDGTTPAPVYVYEGPTPASTPSPLSPSDVWSEGFRGVYHLDGPAGSQALDSTGNGNHMAPSGALSNGDGPVGGSLRMDGGYLEQVTPEDNFQANLRTELTVSAWVNRDAWGNSASDRWRAIVTKGDDTWRLHRSSSSSDASWSTNNGGNNNATLCSGAFDTVGEWIQLVGVTRVVGNDSTETLYDNGVSCGDETSGDRAINANNRRVRIGSNGDVGGREWRGFIDEVRISEVARSAAWIQAVYNNHQSAVVLGPECVRGVTDSDMDGLSCDIDCSDTNPLDPIVGAFDDDGDGATTDRPYCAETPTSPSQIPDCDDTDADASIELSAYLDEDGDGLFATVETSRCTGGFVEPSQALPGVDCDDLDGLVRGPANYYVDADGDEVATSEPSAESVCPGEEPVGSLFEPGADCNDADSSVTAGGQAWYFDDDGDGLSSMTSRTYCSVQPPMNGTPDPGLDCDDSTTAVTVARAYYADFDEDGVPTNMASLDVVCPGSQPLGASFLVGTDCDDMNSAITNLGTVVYLDEDGDGFYAMDGEVRCVSEPPENGRFVIGTDCDDEDPMIGDHRAYYRDADGDGLATMVPSTDRVCPGDLPANAQFESGDDCNDASASVLGPRPYFLDGDGDGVFGSVPDASTCDSEAPVGTSFQIGTDCDDANPQILGRGDYYLDMDGDLQTSVDVALDVCCDAGWVCDESMGTDCDDTDDTIYLGATEISGDGLDQDCDGEDFEAFLVDGGCTCGSGGSSNGLLWIPFGLVLGLSLRRKTVGAGDRT